MLPKLGKVPMGRALTAILLVAVLSTALFLHLVWYFAAARNVDRAVEDLNAGATAAVNRELSRSFEGAEAAAEIIRSALFQGTISPEDEAKREFLFLSVLRSQPTVSWIGFGFPDGRFFGAHSDGENIQMVEIGLPAADGQRPLRRDIYSPIPGDIFFEERVKGISQYVSGGAPWFRAARDTIESVWTSVDLLPSGFDPAAVVSKRVERFGDFVGVVMVAVSYRRISELLGQIEIARSGRAYVVDQNIRVLASSQPPAENRSVNLADYPRDDGYAAAVLQATATHSSGEFRVTEKARALGTLYLSSVELPFRGWRLLTAVPRSYFAGEIDRANRYLPVVVSLLALLASGMAAIFANLLIAGPLGRLARELVKIEQFQLQDIRYVPSRLAEIDEFSLALGKMAKGLAAFGRYIPVEVVRKLVASGVEARPGGDTRRITVLFADLPGFTEMSEKLGPGIEAYLTRFLTLAVDAVEAEGGTVDKFIGDEVMAIWNAPGDVPDHAERATRAAIAIRDRLASIPLPAGIMDRGGPRVRIGVNTGSAIVGNVGSESRLSYTAIGDTVNLASRLVGIAKERSVDIVVSRTTREAACLDHGFQSLGTVRVRGRKGTVTIFSPKDFRSLPMPLVEAET